MYTCTGCNTTDCPLLSCRIIKMRVTLDCFCFIQVPDTALQCNVSIYGEECVRCAKNLITEGCTDNCSVVLVDSVGDPNYRINGEMGWDGGR